MLAVSLPPTYQSTSAWAAPPPPPVFARRLPLSVCSLRRRSQSPCFSNSEVLRLTRHQNQLADEFRDSRVREIVVVPNKRFVDLDNEIGIAARGCFAALERRPGKLDDFPWSI